MKNVIAVAFVLLAIAAVGAAQTWESQTSGTKASLRGLSVVSAKVVWASGTSGTYIRTVNGGETWMAATIPGAESLDFRGIVAFDENTAILMSAGPAEEGKAKLYRTSDAGKHWSEVYSTTKKGAFLDCIAFWDQHHGMAIGDPVDGRFFLLTTNDGGKTWKQLENAPRALAGEAEFAASNSCLVLKGAKDAWFATGGTIPTARVFHSMDGGRTWTAVNTSVTAGAASAGIFSLAFANTMLGIAVGGNYEKPAATSRNIAFTRDGGNTWQTIEGSLYLSGVAFVPHSDKILAVGSNGWAASTDVGQHWTFHEGNGYNAVAFAPTGEGWAVGTEGRIARIRLP
jgi:photosystem II stability/assembly factor-like uncharacterized protein